MVKLDSKFGMPAIALSLACSVLHVQPAAAQDAGADNRGGLEEIVVTAQKRKQSISDVPMSVQAATGDRLIELGIRDVSDLAKVAPGLQGNENFVGTQVFTIRGIGFQDVSMASTPTVGIYVDEMPLPFSALTAGTTLDLERVEVLKGPQGTLFGMNVTGGAINYIAAKPTDTFRAGVDASYGRFNDADISGFISGPLADGVNVRLAGRINQSDAWQKGYGPQAGQSIGGKDLLNARLSIALEPDGSSFSALLTLGGWRDEGYMQMGQLYGVTAIVPGNVAPFLSNYPRAPHDNRAAGFNRCVNTSPLAPIENQDLGAIVPGPTPASYGPGSMVWLGGQPTDCEPARRDNDMINTSLRMDYEITSNVTLTSLTSWLDYNRRQLMDPSGVPMLNLQLVDQGDIESFAQELRLAGQFGSSGNWILGANYTRSKTFEGILNTTSGASLQPVLGALPYGPTNTFSHQRLTDYAFFGNVDFPVSDTFELFAGVRYSNNEIKNRACSADSGDGNTAFTFAFIRSLIGGDPVPTAPGTCITLGYPQDGFVPPADGFNLLLKEDSVSWRGGVNWRPADNTLVYVSASKGYKSGSFTNVGASTVTQFDPVTQESLLAYELGVKTGLFDRQLQLNAAAFHYDYRDKQYLGAIPDLIFGAVQSLVNVPESRVVGFELSAQIAPYALSGLVITPAISYQDSEVLKSGKNTCDSTLTTCQAGHFYNYDIFGKYGDFTGQAFPHAPEWQGSVDAQYKWSIGSGVDAFLGSTVSYASQSKSFFKNPNPPAGFTDDTNDPMTIKSYTVVDLRAGIERGPWTATIWGRNVFDEWYWSAAQKSGDALVRFTGMPATWGASVSYRY